MFGRRTLFTLVAGLGALTVAPAGAAPRVTAVRVGREPGAVAVNSATGSVYVGSGDGTVCLAGARSVAVGGEPTDLAVDETSGRVYVAARTAGTLTVLDADGTLRSVVPCGPGAAVVDVDSAGNRAYVGSGLGAGVAVVDTVACVVAEQLSGPGQGFGGVRVDEARQLAYFASAHTDSVEVLDLTSGEFVSTIPVGRAPAGLALHEASNTLYVANSAIHHLSVVDGATRAERTTILLPSEASSVAVHQASHTVYANGGPDGLVRIDGTTGSVTGTLPLGVNPGGVAVDQRTGTVLVTDPLHDQLLLVREF